MFSNRPILSFYRHTTAAACLAALPFLLNASAPAQTNADYRKDSHQPYLDLLHKVEGENPSSARLGYAWAVVASSYQRSGETDAALRAYSKALPLLAKSAESRVNYATALDNVGEVYLEAGDKSEAEHVRAKAFALRSEIGNPVDIARSHEHLAEVLLAQHRYKQAQEHAESAVAILSTQKEPAFLQVLPASESQATPRPGNTLVAAYISLTLAQCRQSAFADCQRSAKMADEIATRDFSAVSLERAHADVALGFAAWKNGDLETADRKLQGALEMMKSMMGETHPVVVAAMTQYRDYLKSRHQNAKAELLSRSIEYAEAVRMRDTCAKCSVSVSALR
ncbi:hypothetical protein Terro_0005 [Terriglobus roseus DSM 18391]|uniref:Uncharacterized protein n=2 Tax=Terriglobus roseus TaxID=392734 RepID=I3ZAT9_TERRK|nr:hypothetical protein Terro_0005 [Terriglobus roseus DSM 18391]